MNPTSLALALKPCRFVAAACLLVFAATAAHADVTGKVVRILDGDTLEVLVDRTPIRVRLAEIDAPEKRQAFGARARQALADLAFQKTVLVVEAGRDRYGRTVGTVMVDGRNANRAMVESGMAWAYRAYLVDRTLLQVESEARMARKGLWADPAPTPPWLWRAEERAGAE